MQSKLTSANNFAKISFDLSLILELSIHESSVAGLGETNTSHCRVNDLIEWGQELDIKRRLSLPVFGLRDLPPSIGEEELREFLQLELIWWNHLGLMVNKIFKVVTPISTHSFDGKTHNLSTKVKSSLYNQCMQC